MTAAPPAFLNIQPRARCSDKLHQELEIHSFDCARRGMCHTHALECLAGFPRGREEPCCASAASVPSRGWQALRATAAAHQPLAGLTQGRFLLHFLPQPPDSLSKLSVFFFIIPAGIEYDCSHKELRLQLPSGLVCPHHLSDQEACMSLEKYVFQAAGVLICKAHYSNKTLKWPSIEQSLYPCLPLSLYSPRQV